MPEPEIRHLAKQMKQLIDPDLAMVIENPTGAGRGEHHPARRESGHGEDQERSPVADRWYRLLRGMKKVDQGRAFALGVKPGQQNLALGPLLYAEIIDRNDRQGVQDRGSVMDSRHQYRMNGPSK